MLLKRLMIAGMSTPKSWAMPFYVFCQALRTKPVIRNYRGV